MSLSKTIDVFYHIYNPHGKNFFLYLYSGMLLRKNPSDIQEKIVVCMRMVNYGKINATGGF